MAVITLTKMPAQEKKERPGLRQRFLRGHPPVKRSINFAAIGEKPIEWIFAIPAILLIIVLAALFSKVAVVDRIAEVNAAYADVHLLQQQIVKRTEVYENLADIAEDYAHYTVSALTEEERNRISRATVMEVVQDIILPIAPLDAWILDGNTLYIHISSNTMAEVTEMMQLLMDHPSVKKSTITTDSTTVSSNEKIAMQETVTAEVTVEFKTMTEIQKEEAARAAEAAEAAEEEEETS